MKNFAALGLLLVVAGCVTARATMLGPTRNLAPVRADDVLIYLEEEDIPSDCEAIALIDTQGDADATNRTELIEAARRRAGSVGANALLLGEVEEPSTARRVASVIVGINADRRSQLLAYYCDASR